MSDFLSIIRRIKQRLFGKRRGSEENDMAPSTPAPVEESVPTPFGQESSIPLPSSQQPEAKYSGEDSSKHQIDPPGATGTLSGPAVVESSICMSSTSKRSQAYIIQIGLDFGTSFTKCVCRDLTTDKAWVHIPEEFIGCELPFLIPSALVFSGGKLGRVQNQSIHYPSEGMYHLKAALVKAALGQFSDPLLASYQTAISKMNLDIGIDNFVIDCAAYFLATALGSIKRQVRKKMPGFGQHPKDYMAVNLAVPIADVQQPKVDSVFRRVLCDAWNIADELSETSCVKFEELQNLRKRNSTDDDFSMNDACFIYPEVSANVQGFVRSRVSQPGMYMFCDTGAATVDQSTFIYSRQADRDMLAYLHGSVLPLGSSQIELRAAGVDGTICPENLEEWRLKKEHGSNDPKLLKARRKIGESLCAGTQSTLALTRRKLYVQDQLRDIRVIFGGGGHCDDPYKYSTLKPFGGTLFARAIRPDIVGLPTPNDLELDGNQRRWMSRLAVAYGLSFYKEDLHRFIYPKDMGDPDPEEIWSSERRLPEYVTKDQC